MDDTTWHDQRPTHPQVSPIKAHFQQRYDEVRKRYDAWLDRGNDMTPDETVAWWKNNMIPLRDELDETFNDMLAANNIEHAGCTCNDRGTCPTCQIKQKYQSLIGE